MNGALSPSRVAALTAATLVGLSPVVIGLLLPDDEEVTWRMAVVAAALVAGAALLFAGAWLWSGARARQLRVIGFVWLLAASLATVSFAFVLVPLVLLAAFSLRRREPAGGTA
jgi:hypothetical protein